MDFYLSEISLDEATQSLGLTKQSIEAIAESRLIITSGRIPEEEGVFYRFIINVKIFGSLYNLNVQVEEIEKEGDSDYYSDDGETVKNIAMTEYHLNQHETILLRIAQVLNELVIHLDEYDVNARLGRATGIVTK